MRIVVIGAESTDLAAILAERLRLPLVRRIDRVDREEFVLDGAPRGLDEAKELDSRLRSWAAEVDAVLWLRGDPLSPQTEAVLDHYTGRIIELDTLEDVVASALAGLREALLAA